MFSQSVEAVTPMVKERPNRPPRVKPKRFLPVNSELDVKKLEAMKITDDEGSPEFKAPLEIPKSRKKVSEKENSTQPKRAVRSSARKK